MDQTSNMDLTMGNKADTNRAIGRQGRVVSIVIALTAVLWIGAQWLGGELGLPDKYVFLFDLFALAGFLWALIVTWQIWRKSRDNE